MRQLVYKSLEILEEIYIGNKATLLLTKLFLLNNKLFQMIRKVSSHLDSSFLSTITNLLNIAECSLLGHIRIGETKFSSSFFYQLNFSKVGEIIGVSNSNPRQNEVYDVRNLIKLEH